MANISAREQSSSSVFESYSDKLGFEFATDVAASAADIAFMVNNDLEILEVTHCNPDVVPLAVTNWVGHKWTDTVTAESRPKILRLVEDTKTGSKGQWRQVNHPMGDGPDLPVRYVGVKIGDTGSILAIGREMQGMSNLQQDLITTQQAMEREYTRLREAETKYRALFQVTNESVLILDSSDYRVVDANPTAIEMLGLTAGQLVGRFFRDWVDAEDQATLTELFASVRRTGNPMSDTVRFKSIEDMKFIIEASLFRQGINANLLVRVNPFDSSSVLHQSSNDFGLAEIVSRLPEAIVITDVEGRIRTSNTNFLELTQLPTLKAAEGESIGRWIGRSDYELLNIINGLIENDSPTKFTTISRGELGLTEEIEVFGVAVTDSNPPVLGFAIRSIELRSAAGASTAVLSGAHSVEEMSNLIGRVSLKEIVREATDVIEKLAIQAALQHTGDNRALASELLGLSRQSLYVKLHRYNIGDLPPKA